MLPEERKQIIYEMVNEKRSLRVSELSHMTGASEATIRRDLEDLSKMKKLRRSHGGAVAISFVGEAVKAPELIKSPVNILEKKKIAECAYHFVENKDTLFVDGSSTVYELIKIIASNDEKQLTIITTSLMTLTALTNTKNIKVIMLSGEMNYPHSLVEGHLTTEGIRNMRADKCFIGINGIDESFGYSTPRFSDAETKEAMILSSKQAFILADKSKFGAIYMTRVNTEVDYIITDEPKRSHDYGWLHDRCNVCFADRHKE